MTKELFFFTSDGTYGSADPEVFAVVDTSLWTDEDWAEVEDTNDSNRIEVVCGLGDKYSGEVDH